MHMVLPMLLFLHNLMVQLLKTAHTYVEIINVGDLQITIFIKPIESTMSPLFARLTERTSVSERFWVKKQGTGGIFM